MKVLHIHSSDFIGGGGGTVAMERLHHGLRQVGVDSNILCGHKTTSLPDSTAIPKLEHFRKVEQGLKKVTTRLGLNDIHILNSFLVTGMEVYQKADILHIHGTHGYFNYLALPNLTGKKPAVFSLHDIWPLTGHCAVSYDCRRWQVGCGHCPYLDVNPAVKRDGTNWEWKLKNWVYHHSNLTIVALCSEIKKQAEQSMLNQFPIYQIPNGVDINLYRPLDRQESRLALGLPPDKKVLMFAALDLKQANKGGHLLITALKKLPDNLKSECVLLTIGKGAEAITDQIDMPAYNLGYIRDDHQKAVCFSAADIFVSPTRAEAFGLVILESMACGTPAVAFGVGGVIDLVRPGQTGYRAEVDNADDLRDGIVQLLTDESLRLSMGQQSRMVAVNEYSLTYQVQEQVKLYQKILAVKAYPKKRLDTHYEVGA